MHLGACIFGCSGNRLTDRERRFFRDARPAGFILFDRNSGTHREIQNLAGELREAAGHDALVLVDHEGGRVQRFRGDGWRDWLPALDQCDMVAADRRARSMWLRYRIIAAELARAGISGNCVPLADVADDATHPVLRNRCYGTDPDSVVPIARAVAGGCLDGGIIPVLKHIPGHGGTNADSHTETPVNRKSLETLQATEFRTFRELADLPLGMTSHVVYDALDSAAPATLSPVVVEFIRNEIGFDGLLMTDDISMSALTYTIAERVNGALRAGCDIILHCNGDLSEMLRIAEAAGPLPAAARARLERAQLIVRNRQAVNLPAMEEELAELLGTVSC